MKKITLIFLLFCSIVFGQDLGNPAIIGQTNRNQKVGKGFQIEDTLLVKGKVFFKNLSISTDTFINVSDINGKIGKIGKTSLLNSSSQTLSISNDTLTISNGNSVILPIYFQSDSATITSYDVLNSQNAPPISPNTGDTYLVGTSPSGAWVGHAKDIAEWNGSSWDFTDGVQGDFLYNATTALTYIFRSGNWVQTTGIPALNNGNTISSGLKIGTNNLKSLTFETNNKSVSRFDSIGRFYVYDTSLRKANKYLQIDSITGRLVASDISGGGSSALFPNGIEFVSVSRDFRASDAGKIIVLMDGVNLTMPEINPFSAGDNILISTYTDASIGNLVTLINGDSSTSLLAGEHYFITNVDIEGNIFAITPSSSNVLDDDGNAKTLNKYLYDKSQNVIPLSGTEVGKPVTGDIEMSDLVMIKNTSQTRNNGINLEGDIIRIGSWNPDDYQYKTGGSLTTSAGNASIIYYDDSLNQAALTCDEVYGVRIYDNILNRGLTSYQDFTANITDLDYTQKIYVGFRGTATLSSGTVTVTTDKIKTGYKIYLSVNTPSGTQGFLSAPTGSIVNEISFVINSSSVLDNSTVNWWITP